MARCIEGIAFGRIRSPERLARAMERNAATLVNVREQISSGQQFMNRCQMRLYALSILRSYRNRTTGAIGTPVCSFGILNDQLRCVFFELRGALCIVTVQLGIRQARNQCLESALRYALTLA